MLFNRSYTTGHKSYRARATVELAEAMGWDRARPALYAGVPDIAVGPRWYSTYEMACLVIQNFMDGRDAEYLAQDGALTAPETHALLEALASGEEPAFVHHHRGAPQGRARRAPDHRHDPARLGRAHPRHRRPERLLDAPAQLTSTATTCAGSSTRSTTRTSSSWCSWPRPSSTARRTTSGTRRTTDTLEDRAAARRGRDEPGRDPRQARRRDHGAGPLRRGPLDHRLPGRRVRPRAARAGPRLGRGQDGQRPAQPGARHLSALGLGALDRGRPRPPAARPGQAHRRAPQVRRRVRGLPALRRRRSPPSTRAPCSVAATTTWRGCGTGGPSCSTASGWPTSPRIPPSPRRCGASRSSTTAPARPRRARSPSGGSRDGRHHRGHVAPPALGDRTWACAAPSTATGRRRRTASWGARPITWPRCSPASPWRGTSSPAGAASSATTWSASTPGRGAEDLYVAYAIVPPQVDRTRPAHQLPEPYLHPGVVRERDGGIVLRGCQAIATSAAMADWLLLTYITPLAAGDDDYAISVVMPVAAPGLKLYPRRPFAPDGDQRLRLPAVLALRRGRRHRGARRRLRAVGARVRLPERGPRERPVPRDARPHPRQLPVPRALRGEAPLHGRPRPPARRGAAERGDPAVQAALGGDVAALCATFEAIVHAAERFPLEASGWRARIPSTSTRA